jgi:hypothetical protein
MKYNNIKTVLRNNIRSKVKNLWTWDKQENHFTCIYERYNDDLPIYTPQQLLDEIDKEIKMQDS